MPKTLILVGDVVDALKTLSTVMLEGDLYYDQDAVIETLDRTLGLGLRHQQHLAAHREFDRQRETVTLQRDEVFGPLRQVDDDPATIGLTDTPETSALREELFGERGDLLGLDREPLEMHRPTDDVRLGPCVGCGHPAHAGDACFVSVDVDPDGAPITCECDDYVDSTVRGVPMLDEHGQPFPCTCGHERHEGPCPRWRLDHEENGPCLCTVYDPDRGPGPGGDIAPVPGPDPATLGFTEGRLMRNAPPRDG